VVSISASIRAQLVPEASVLQEPPRSQFVLIGDQNPAWQDTMRPTKLPAFHDEFGKGTRTYGSVRQTRFGVKSTTPTR
jgi:hypothetical protein